MHVPWQSHSNPSRGEPSAKTAQVAPAEHATDMVRSFTAMRGANDETELRFWLLCGTSVNVNGRLAKQIQLYRIVSYNMVSYHIASYRYNERG